jgi:putative transposase
MLAGLTPSIRTIGDALDNALPETTIGLYKPECIRDDSPFRNGPLETLADANRSPQHGPTGTTPAGSYAALAGGHQPKPRPGTTITTVPATPARHTHNEACMKPGSPQSPLGPMPFS